MNVIGQIQGPSGTQLIQVVNVVCLLKHSTMFQLRIGPNFGKTS